MRFLCKGVPFFACLMPLVSVAHAASTRASGAVVYVNNLAVFHIYTWSGSLSPQVRARAIAANLGGLGDGGDVTVRPEGAERVLVVGAQQAITVTRGEAMRHGCSVASLASSWAARLQAALNLPPLKVTDNFARLPLGGSVRIGVSGSEAAGAGVSVSPGGIVSVRRDPGSLRLTGTGVGDATITLSGGMSQEVIDVRVKPYAANFPQTINAYVSGAPATPDTVRRALEGAVRTELSAMPNAKWSFRHVVADPLAPESEDRYRVRVWASAPGSYPSGGIVQVTVKNKALPPVTDSDLWYSNNPETVKAPGCLFSAELQRGDATRLLYHHVNGTNQDMFVRVEAINDSAETATVMLIPGDSRPDKNPVIAGMRAADQFLRNWQTGSGEVLRIPPKSAMPISLRRLSPGDTTSGLCSIRLVSGPKTLHVRTDAFPPFQLDGRWSKAVYSSTPWDFVGSHPINGFDTGPYETSQRIFPDPYKQERFDYSVGGRYGFLRIGQKPLEQEDNDGSLDGNFGVIYNITANVTNPTSTGADVELVVEASAGYAGGLFVVNGSYLKTPLLAPKEQARIVRFHLAPGGSRFLNITTLPLSGSSYPITLTVRPVQGDSGSSSMQTARSVRT